MNEHEVIAQRVAAVSVTSLSKSYASCSHTSINEGISTIRLMPSWTPAGRAVPSAAADHEKVMPSWPLWHVQKGERVGEVKRVVRPESALGMLIKMFMRI